ncbi:MAG: dockerin type I domain-containing protein [Ferruginibacter sp.]
MKGIKFSFLLASLLALGYFPQAQLYINGATFVIQSGATVTAQGDVQNAGTLTNDGILQVQGNFSNTSVYNGTVTTGVLQMTGTGNVTLNAGASVINNLLINKTSATDRVLLTNTASVGYTFTLTNGVFSTDPILNPLYTLTAPAAATFSFAAGKEVSGRVKRTFWANAAPTVFNQPNMQITTSNGTNPADITVNMIPFSEGGDPTQAEREVKRKYTFLANGGSGYTADVRYPYLGGELNTNIETNLVPWQLVSTEWNGRLSPVTRDGVNDYVSTTGIPASEFNQEWKLADPKYTFNVTAQLRGPWNNTDMNTTMNSAGLIPNAQPYNTTPFNYTGTENQAVPNANVVDWVLVEHRKPLSGLATDAISATISGRQAGYLLKTGQIVGLDGINPIAFDITKQGSSYIVVRHRNHLGVMSNAIASNAAGTFANDYSILANSYKPVSAPSDPVVLLSGVTGKYGLWAGDANKSGAINATDVNTVKAAVANSSTGYLLTDVNMSNSINATDVNLTKNTVAASGTGGTFLVKNNKPITTNIPDKIIE